MSCPAVLQMGCYTNDMATIKHLFQLCYVYFDMMVGNIKVQRSILPLFFHGPHLKQGYLDKMLQFLSIRWRRLHRVGNFCK